VVKSNAVAITALERPNTLSSGKVKVEAGQKSKYLMDVDIGHLGLFECETRFKNCENYRTSGV